MVYPIPCGDVTCVVIEKDAAGNYLATSSISEDKGAVVYTPEEIAAFLSDVKAGKYDQLHAEARAEADRLASV